MLRLYNYFKKYIATDVFTQSSNEIARYEVEYNQVILIVEFIKRQSDFFFSIIFTDIENDFNKETILHDIVLECFGHDENDFIYDPKKVKIWIDILKDSTKVDEMLQLVAACMEDYNDDR